MRLDPENVTAMGLLGSCLNVRGRRPEAVTLLAQASRLNPHASGYRESALAAFGAQSWGLRAAASVAVLTVVVLVGAPVLFAVAGIAAMWLVVIARLKWVEHRERSSPLADAESYLAAKRALMAESRRWNRRGVALRLVVVGLTFAVGFGFEVSDDAYVQTHEVGGGVVIAGFMVGIALAFGAAVMLTWRRRRA